MTKNISPKVINRFTLYFSILIDCIDNEIDYVSSKYISSILRIDQSQVRKDFQVLTSQGICNLGYSTKELKKEIEQYLGFQKSKDIFIVGAGNLGMALAKYDHFADYGLNIVALFDIDSSKIGTNSTNKPIFHIDRLKNLIERMNVEIIILTVPRKSAQYIANLLAQTKIKYIWNFTPAVLNVPQNIAVWSENLIGSFLQFTKGNKER